MKMKILYIGNDVSTMNATSGAEVVNKRNYTLLSRIFKGNIDIIVPEDVRCGLIYDW